MASIVEFLEARIDEDEAEARRTLEQIGMVAEAKADLRAFAECAAKRKIIALAGGVEHLDSRISEVLEALASVYKDHPDYRQEWPRG